MFKIKINGKLILFSKHAQEQMEIRNISTETVIDVVENPDGKTIQEENLTVFTKVVDEGSKRYLYRAFINHTKEPEVLVTVYKTSKIEKYGHQI